MVPGLIGCSTRENEPPVSSPDNLNTTPSPGPSQTDFPSSFRTEKCSLRTCILFPFAPFTSLLVKTIVHVEKIVTSHIGLHEKPCVSRSPMPSRTLDRNGREVFYIQGHGEQVQLPAACPLETEIASFRFLEPRGK